MKRKVLGLSAASLLVLSVVATPQEASASTNVFVPTIAKTAKKVKVKKIAHNKTPKAMYVGASHSVKVTFNPKKPTNKKYTVSTSNKKVIKVSGTKIKALKAGSATITVKSKDGGKTHKVTVTVKTKPVAVKSIKHSKTPTSMNVGAKHSVKVTFNPSKPTSKTYSVATSNKKIIKVSGKSIQALKPGKATITVKSGNGKTHKVNVTVKQPVTSIKHSKTPTSMTVGGTHTVATTIAPSNATDKSFSVSSSNTKIVAVSGKKLTAKAPGIATITVKSGNGKTHKVNVTVKQPVTSIKHAKTPTSMTVGGTHTVTTTITPSNATDKSFSVSSSNTKIVAVSGKKLTAKAPGTATITVKSGNGKTHTAKVTVKAKTIEVTGIAHSKTPTSMKVGDAHVVSATISPSNATDKSFTVATDNAKVVAISGKTLSAKAPGTATITVKSSNGKTHKVTIVVKEFVKAESVELNTIADMNKWDDQVVTAIIKPDDADEKDVTYTTSDENVIKIEGDKLIAKGAGQVTITVTVDGTTLTDSQVVNVTNLYPNAGGKITEQPSDRPDWQAGKTEGRLYDIYGEALPIFDLDNKPYSQDGIGYDYAGNKVDVRLEPVVEVKEENEYGDESYLTNPNDTDMTTSAATWSGLKSIEGITTESINETQFVTELGYRKNMFDAYRTMSANSTYKTYVDGVHLPELDKNGRIYTQWVKVNQTGEVKNIAFPTYEQADNWARLNIGNHLGYQVWSSGKWRQNEKFTVVFKDKYSTNVNNFLKGDGSDYTYIPIAETMNFVSTNHESTKQFGDKFENDTRLYQLLPSEEKLVHLIRDGRYTTWKDQNGNFAYYEYVGNDTTYATYNSNRKLDKQLDALGVTTRELDADNWIGWVTGQPNTNDGEFVTDQGLPNASELVLGQDYINGIDYQ